MASVAIIGAGIAGLTAARVLEVDGLEVTVFEATDQAGGAIRSERANGYLLEHGPNTVRSTALLERLITSAGLDDQCITPTDAARTRYIVRNGTLHPVPSSIGGLLTTPLLSWQAKARLLLEPFVPAQEGEESIADFVRRRLGTEVLDYAVNPFIAGVFAGDPEALSVRHALPRLHALEREHGSLARGALHAFLRRTTESDDAPQRQLFSFREGLQTLPRTLARQLRRPVRFRTPVTAFHQYNRRWRVQTASDTASFDALIYAAPLHHLADIDFSASRPLAPLLEVSYPSVSVLALAYRRADVVHPLDGFGLLVPAVEKDVALLGVLFPSTLFADRAPPGRVLLTLFVGGARHPGLPSASTDSLLDRAQRDLRALLGIDGPPTLVRRVDWPRAIPQYRLGYGRVKALLDALETQHPGLFWAGNYRQGISVGDAAASGDAAGRRALHFIKAGVPYDPTSHHD